MNEIALTNLYYSRNPKSENWILENLNTNFSSQSPSLIIGETGAGKSTLLQILAAFKRPTSGECSVNGDPVSRWTSHFRDFWRKDVGVVHQFPLMISQLSVRENLMLPILNRKMPQDSIQEKLSAVIHQLDLEPLQNQKAANLSGGEAQRLSLARALMVEPQFLFMDEPTAHQDAQQLEKMAVLWETLKARDCLIIAASHDPRLLDLPLFTHRLQLKDGHLEPT